MDVKTPPSMSTKRVVIKYLTPYPKAETSFRLKKRDNYFWVNFDHFWSKQCFFEAAVVVVKIGTSLKQITINKFKQIKLVQICERSAERFKGFCQGYNHKPQNSKNPSNSEIKKILNLYHLNKLCFFIYA